MTFTSTEISDLLGAIEDAAITASRLDEREYCTRLDTLYSRIAIALQAFCEHLDTSAGDSGVYCDTCGSQVNS